MRILSLAGAILLLPAMPSPVVAQEWSPQQLEVWNAEVACINSHVDPIDWDARKACMHPDFIGWGVEDPVPTAFDDKELEYLFGRTIIRLEEMTPLRILVEGDLAVIQLVVHTVMSTDGGPDEETWVGWTDVMKREGGTWRWIADHGHWIKGEPGG
ncbi:MAG: nuclear transport factor 2 family protein [Gemmatimonadetes bacterium]|nr:nuclear transport factor 2 family protein [Gemmatimonadota bacterium]NNL31272.1 nuclear transport factor 2 family protein [Gemmatimonadota bacterium]